jgi:hypothetical protein
MEKARWLLFWAAVALTAFGIIDRITPQPIFEGIAAGTYWKGGLSLVAFSIALSLLRPAK